MPSVDRFAKTPKAWEALSRPDLIGREARALLLMANGRRSERELSVLLGTDVAELAYGLMADGYLQETTLTVPSESDEDSGGPA